jgi:hypothetical protein
MHRPMPISGFGGLFYYWVYVLLYLLGVSRFGYGEKRKKRKLGGMMKMSYWIILCNFVGLIVWFM